MMEVILWITPTVINYGEYNRVMRCGGECDIEHDKRTIGLE